MTETVRLAAAVIVAAFTIVGVALFARACLVLVARMRLGQPAPDRRGPFLARTAHMLGEILGHSAFRSRPWIRVAHWLVMVSFPLLFLTLVTGYGQVFAGPSFHLPWLDSQVWWSWIVEGIAWLSAAGILLLMGVRRRATRQGSARPPFPESGQISDDGQPTSRTSRFAGSSARQAQFVEAVVLGVVLCVLALRMLEATHRNLLETAGAASYAPSTAALYPLTAWASPLLDGLGLSGVETAIVVVASIKVIISMSWMVVVGLQPSMGVAWHRFLAVVNVYAKRDLSEEMRRIEHDAAAAGAAGAGDSGEAAAADKAAKTRGGAAARDSQTAPSKSGSDAAAEADAPAEEGATASDAPDAPSSASGITVPGRKALGPAKPLHFAGADGRERTLTGATLDDLDEAMEAAEERGEELRLGVGRIEDFTWKGLLDFSTCTECGRCQDLCPAWNTGKPLSPKLFTLALRDHHAAVAPYLQAAQRLGVPAEEVTEEQAREQGTLLPGSIASTLPGALRDLRRLDSPAGLAEGSAHTGDILGALLEAKAAPSDTGVATVPAPLAGEVIPADVLWSCTTCGACVDQCPVDIEHVDHVIDVRRQQVLMESAFPKELGQMFRKLESKGNPWGLAPRKRLEWAKGLDFEVPVVGVDVEDAREVDYLFWVGCAGAFEDRAKKTTRAVAELLHTAGVSFAVLGDGESCTGDLARRAGNEILFQMLAAQNIETLNEVGAQRIVVTCAHCFNTIAREYPQAGGHYEVLHHTQLLSRLVRDGRLKPVAPGTAAGASQVGTTQAADETREVAKVAEALAEANTGASSEASAGAPDADTPVGEAQGGSDRSASGSLPLTVTVHDACYLGRHNQIYSPPRELVEATGARAVEMPRSRERAMCCGGGGAHAFMEEKIGTRISHERAKEAIGTGAQVIATACPFCTTMLSDGAAAQGADVEVRDVATLMLDAVRRGQHA